MINMVMLVGRLAQDPEIFERENGKKISRVTLAVNRKFKSTDGTYRTDFIDCVLWNTMAKNISEYCSKGDLIGIRGRIQVEHYEKDGVKRKIVEVIAEGITFLSTKSTKEEYRIVEEK